MGNVLQASLGQAPATQVAIKAGKLQVQAISFGFRNYCLCCGLVSD